MTPVCTYNLGGFLDIRLLPNCAPNAQCPNFAGPIIRGTNGGYEWSRALNGDWAEWQAGSESGNTAGFLGLYISEIDKEIEIEDLIEKRFEEITRSNRVTDRD